MRATPRGSGWVGRVAARTHTPDPRTFLTLAVPGETSTRARRALGGRGRRAGSRPTPTTGSSWPWAGPTSPPDLSIARSRLNLANILDVAESAPGPDVRRRPAAGRTEDNERLADLSAAFADVASRRRVPYVDTFTPLVAHEQWLGDLAAGDGLLPGQAGYGMMAWLVLHTGWHAWLGLPDDAA